MAVTSLTVTDIGGGDFRLDFASGLADPTFYVYRDGVLVTATKLASLVVAAGEGSSPVYEVLDDAAAKPGAAYPDYALLAWYAGPGAGEYLIEEGSVGTYRDAVTADSPVGAWPLGEATGAFLDVSGNGLSGAAAGTVVRAVSGIVAGGATTDRAVRVAAGSAGRVEVPDHALLDTPNALTAEAWVRFDDAPGGTRRWAISKWVSPDNGWFLECEPEGAGWRAWVQNGATFASVAFFGLIDTEPHHVALVCDPFGDGKLRLYVDGIERGTAADYTDPIPANSASVQFGGLSGTFELGGVVQWAAVYEAALTPARILAHHDAGTGVVPAAVPGTWTERARVGDGDARPEAPTITVVQDGGTELDGTWELEYAPTASQRFRWYWTDGTTSVEISGGLLLIGDGLKFITYQADPTYSERPPSGETATALPAPWVLQLSNVTSGSPHGSVAVDAAAADLFFARRYFTWMSRGLEDSAHHPFRVTPIGANGNAGVVKNFSVLMVRIPDPPAVAYSYDAGTGAVTISGL